jgi:hypothetical protein
MVKISADRVSKVPCGVNRGDKELMEDRLNRFNEDFKADSEKSRFINRTVPVHDQAKRAPGYLLLHHS